MFKQYLLSALAFASLTAVTPSPYPLRACVGCVGTGQGATLTLGDTINQAVHSAMSSVMSGLRFATSGGENYIINLGDGAPLHNNERKLCTDSVLGSAKLVAGTMEGHVVSETGSDLIVDVRSETGLLYSFQGIFTGPVTMPVFLATFARLKYTDVSAIKGDWNFVGTFGPKTMEILFTKEGAEPLSLTASLISLVAEAYPIEGKGKWVGCDVE